MALWLKFGCVMALAAAMFAQSRAKRVTPVDSAQQSGFSQAKMAVVVGVGAYPTRSGLSELRYPAGDVDALTAALESQGYTVVPLKDGEATRPAILRAVRNVGEVLDRGQGTVVFFFSGHGFAVGSRNYLATYESTALTLSQSGLALEDLQEQLQATGAPRRILWIDACRNQPGKGVADVRSFSSFQAAAGTRILFSTKAGKLSYENDDLRHGVFTHFLLEGLKGGASGNDGLVTFRDLADYVSASVRDYSLKRGDVQIPYDAGEAAGDFLVAKGTGAVVDPGPARGTAPKPTETMDNQGTLLVESDADASLTIDTDGVGPIKAGEVGKFKLIPGSHILRATSGGSTWRKVVNIRPGDQQVVAVELTTILRDAAMRAIEGSWSEEVDRDGRFANNARRYHIKGSATFRVTRSGEGVVGVWHETLYVTGIDNPKADTEARAVNASFFLQGEGNHITGVPQAVHYETSKGFKQDLSGSEFEGRIDAAGKMTVNIVWFRDAQGNVRQSSQAHLTKAE